MKILKDSWCNKSEIALVEISAGLLITKLVMANLYEDYPISATIVRDLCPHFLLQKARSLQLPRDTDLFIENDINGMNYWSNTFKEILLVKIQASQLALSWLDLWRANNIKQKISNQIIIKTLKICSCQWLNKKLMIYNLGSYIIYFREWNLDLNNWISWYFLHLFRCVSSSKRPFEILLLKLITLQANY